MTSWAERVASIGLGADAAALATRHFTDVADQHAAVFGTSQPARAWWVPGRIEVLGKHTDYGGGRSLLCAVERGFQVVAAPRDDKTIRIVDSSTRASVTIPLSADAAPRPGHWTDYPITVVRRVARDFAASHAGMNAMIRSSLPSAAGVSSSSALVIASFLPLAAFNRLGETPEWSAIPDDDALAGYLGAMENGRTFGAFPADRGVGTHGGSEDQTAILRARPGQLLQYHFMPVTHEATIPLPAGWLFVIGVSGVHAAKGGAVQARYNALAADVAALLALWREHTGRADESLFAALQSAVEAGDRLAALVAASAPPLGDRLTQFRTECEVIIPQVGRHLQQGDVAAIGDLVAQSQSLAEDTLRNQIPETVHLARTARESGAVAASAFGAGFGGSVWALIPEADAPAFATRWRNAYLARFPDRRLRAEFFASRPGPAATEL